MAKLGKKVLAVDFNSQANMSACLGIEGTVTVTVTIGHFMMTYIKNKEMPALEEYILNRKGVDFIPSSMVLSVVDVKIQLEMGAEKILSNILEPLKEKYNVIIIAWRGMTRCWKVAKEKVVTVIIFRRIMIV